MFSTLFYGAMLIVLYVSFGCLLVETLHAGSPLKKEIFTLNGTFTWLNKGLGEKNPTFNMYFLYIYYCEFKVPSGTFMVSLACHLRERVYVEL